MENVSIINTFTNQGMVTDSSGNFTLNVDKGHLIEFRRMDFKIARVRIESDNLPYYQIAMKEGVIDLQEVEIRGSNFKSDSIEHYETYKWAIEHYKLEGMDIIKHPFDAMSKRNRQIWAFQKRYEYFEKEKFVDFVFNEKLIKRITSLKDSADIFEFRRQYRPYYEEIKLWTEYEYLEYVKNSADAYLRRKQRRMR